MALFKAIKNIIVGIIFSSVFIYIFINGADTFTRVAIIPFFIGSTSILIKHAWLLIKEIIIIKSIKNNENNNSFDILESGKSYDISTKINKLANNIYVFGFLIFWFGFLIVFDYSAIKDWNDGGNSMFFFSIIFWIVGISIFIKNFKRNR